MSACSDNNAGKKTEIPAAKPLSQAETALPADSTKHYTINIIRQFPHSTDSYTQGLIYHNGHLYESTGLAGASSLQKIDAMTGNVLDIKPLGGDYFGEGIDIYKGKIFQLTWQNGTCFVYDLNTLNKVRNFSYFGEGWGLAFDGDKFVMSDGSFVLKYINPEDFSFVGSKMIHYLNGRPAYDLNELEFAEGFLWANIWQKDLIAKIDTAQGKVVGLVDINPLRDIVKSYRRSEVSNGIAYNPKAGTFFLTGKYWPLFFEVEIVEKK